MTQAISVYIIATDTAEAERIAEALVAERLAACVNILSNIRSVYRWQGKVDSSAEWLLLIKTTVEKFPNVRAAIRDLHSYDLPECIAIVVEGGSEEYLDWIADSVAD